MTRAIGETHRRVAARPARGRADTLRRMDVAAIEATLARLGEGLAEARAAVALLQDGDPTALQELDGVVEAMASELAALKTQTTGVDL